MKTLTRMLAEEEGQGMTEYALVISLVALGVIASLIVFRNYIRNTFEATTNGLQNT